MNEAKRNELNTPSGYVSDVVEKVIQAQCSRTSKEIQDDLLLFDDLGMDSIDFVDMVMEVEESLDLFMIGNEFDNCETVGDVKEVAFSLHNAEIGQSDK